MKTLLLTWTLLASDISKPIDLNVVVEDLRDPPMQPGRLNPYVDFSRNLPK